MSDYIPDDIWPDVLKRLTPEELILCRCVCKSWNSLICSSSFIATHLALQTPKLIAPLNDKEEEYILFNRETLPDAEILHCPFTTHDTNDYFRFVGTIHGVICLCYDDTNYVLWNPLIAKHIKPPPPIYWFEPIHPSSYCTKGFGFDPSTGALKIVRMIISKGYDQISHKAEVFSLTERTWKEVTHFDHVRNCFTGQDQQMQCLINGAVHWNAYKKEKNGQGSINLVLLFDFELEEFKTIDLPDEVRKYGAVASWAKMFSVNLAGDVKRILWVKDDKCEMLLSTLSGQLLSYNAILGGPQRHGRHCKKNAFISHDFVESLVLLDMDCKSD